MVIARHVLNKADTLGIKKYKIVKGKMVPKSEKELKHHIDKRAVAHKKKKVINKTIKTPKGWTPKPYRKHLPPECFLDYPNYPYCSVTKEPNCKGLLAAQRRATMLKNNKISEKARKTAKRYKCNWASGFGQHNSYEPYEHEHQWSDEEKQDVMNYFFENAPYIPGDDMIIEQYADEILDELLDLGNTRRIAPETVEDAIHDLLRIAGNHSQRDSISLYDEIMNGNL